MTTAFIGVTFKASSDKLVSMFSQSFTSVEDAKQTIEEDAKFWLSKHGKVAGKWIAPEDYYIAMGKDGETCIWQYFTMQTHT